MPDEDIDLVNHEDMDELPPGWGKLDHITITAGVPQPKTPEIIEWLEKRKQA